jgi:hypothetical protein
MNLYSAEMSAAVPTNRHYLAGVAPKPLVGRFVSDSRLASESGRFRTEN